MLTRVFMIHPPGICPTDLFKEEISIKEVFFDKELYLHTLPDLEIENDLTFYKIYLSDVLEYDIIWFCDGCCKERRLRVLRDCLCRLGFTIYGEKIL